MSFSASVIALRTSKASPVHRVSSAPCARATAAVRKKRRRPRPPSPTARRMPSTFVLTSRSVRKVLCNATSSPSCRKPQAATAPCKSPSRQTMKCRNSSPFRSTTIDRAINPCSPRQLIPRRCRISESISNSNSRVEDDCRPLSTQRATLGQIK